MNKFQRNIKRNSQILIQEIALKNVVCEMSAILSRPLCVNALLDELCKHHYSNDCDQKQWTHMVRDKIKWKHVLKTKYAIRNHVVSVLLSYDAIVYYVLFQKCSLFALNLREVYLQSHNAYKVHPM